MLGPRNHGRPQTAQPRPRPQLLPARRLAPSSPSHLGDAHGALERGTCRRPSPSTTASAADAAERRHRRTLPPTWLYPRIGAAGRWPQPQPSAPRARPAAAPSRPACQETRNPPTRTTRSLSAPSPVHFRVPATSSPAMRRPSAGLASGRSSQLRTRNSYIMHLYRLVFAADPLLMPCLHRQGRGN